MSRLRRAAVLAFCAHLLAGFSMAVVLRRGLETTSVLQDRLAFLANHRALWTAAWLTWTVASVAILYFYMTFADAHLPASRLPVLLTVIALGPDLAAQAIEIGVLPPLALHAFSTNSAPELFLTLHRVAVMLSGYLANGLYSITAIILTWRARHTYAMWISVAGLAVGVFGIGLSVASLLDSTAGMFWTNVLLVPALLIWLAAVAMSGANVSPPGRNRQQMSGANVSPSGRNGQ